MLMLMKAKPRARPRLVRANTITHIFSQGGDSQIDSNQRYVSIVLLKLVNFQHIKSRSQFLRISTLSVVFCASVVGGNISLRYLPVSFNQAVGATTPFFTALFAYLITSKREAWVTYTALVPVVAGVVIATGMSMEEISPLYTAHSSDEVAISTKQGFQAIKPSNPDIEQGASTTVCVVVEYREWARGEASTSVQTTTTSDWEFGASEGRVVHREESREVENSLTQVSESESLRD
nr:probable sugar phosphate/phosphate translocator At5g04160 [Ipomoea batatas]